jgi:hypothetical protein
MKRILMVFSILVVAAGTTGAQQKFIFPEEVKPLVTSQWSQGEPYNLLCPAEKKDTVLKHAFAGCGPIVMSQVIRSHRFPHRYNYDLMFDQPTDSTTDSGKAAVAQLVRDCGTAAGTQYGQTASSTVTKWLVIGMKRDFGYSRYMHITERRYYPGEAGDKAWKTLLYNELKAGRPVFYRGIKNKRNAHVFIVDGCRDSLVHVNFGWGGPRNGYYDLDSLYGFTASQQMAIEIAPDSAFVPSTKHVRLLKAGTLAKHITGDDWYSMHHLQVSGPVNHQDIALLRQLAGGGRKHERNGNLSSVDLRYAVILTLPDSAFYGCDNLTYISLPLTLPEISRCAFSKCGYLNQVDIHRLVAEIKPKAFYGCYCLMKIDLPQGLQRIAANAFNSCNSLTTVTVPASVQKIETAAFANMQKLRALYVSRYTEVAPRATRGSNCKIIKR